MNWSVTNALALIFKSLEFLYTQNFTAFNRENEKLSAKESKAEAFEKLEIRVERENDETRRMVFFVHHKTGSMLSSSKLRQIAQISKLPYLEFMEPFVREKRAKGKASLRLRSICLSACNSVVAYSAHATFVSLQLVYPPRLPFNFLSVSFSCCLVGKKHAFSRMIVDEVNINLSLGIVSTRSGVHALLGVEHY